MARVVIGICPQCGAILKIREHAARPSVRYTCACGWTAAIAIDEAVVARGEKLRKEQLAVRHRRLAEKQTRLWRLIGGTLAVASIMSLLAAWLLPHLSQPTVNLQPAKLLMYTLFVGCALGVAFAMLALRDVEHAMERARRKKRRRR